jgi:hypothetical protein
MCGLQIRSTESPTNAESATDRVGVVGAEARVSADIAGMDMCSSC